MTQNLVLVTVDSLRADHCNFMGYDKETTPTLDQMSEEGLVFKNAIAPGPRTPESMPAIFTGSFPSDSLPQAMIDQRSTIEQHMRTRRTLPEQLSEKGYHTIGFSPNPFASRYFGFDEGFDEFHDFLGESDSNLYQRLFRGWLGGDTSSNVLRLARNMIQREEVFKPWEAFYDSIVEAVEEAPEPYFLWVFLMDVHEPYLAGKGYRSLSSWERWKSIWKLYLGDKETDFSDTTRERLITAYDNSIRYADAFLERLLSDTDDNTVVAVHGDHGEAFGEHGYYSHEPYLYEESIHVPLVIHGAGEGTVERPTSLLDLTKLLTNISEADEFTGTDIAEARTANHDTVALRSQLIKYIDTNDGSELYRLNQGEQDQIDDEQARQLYSQLASSSREQTQEQRRIRELVAESFPGEEVEL